VKSQGKISGKFDDFAAHVNLNSRSLRIKDLEIKGMKTELRAKGLPQKPVGTIRLEASAMNQSLQVDSDFAWNGKTLTVGDARVQAPGIDLMASLDVTPGTEDFSGKVKGRITSLEIVQALTGVEARGTGSFQIEADKTITLDANFKDLKYQDYGASTLNVTARVDDLKKMQGKASLKATNMPFGSSRLETLKLEAAGALSGTEITLETKGVTQTDKQAESGAPLFLNTKLKVKRTDLWQLRLESLKAGYEGLKVNLQKPATLTYEVTLELSGPLADPGVNVAVHVKEYKVMGRDGTQPILLNVKLNSRRDGERLLADLELSGLGKTPFKAVGSIPAHISLKPFAFDMDKNGRLEAKS